jgi:hypothetical protein
MSARGLLTFDRILRVVAEQSGVGLDQLLGPGGNGKGPADRARRRAIFLTRRLRPHVTRGAIGRRLGGRDISTIQYAYDVGEKLYLWSAAEQSAVQALLDALGVQQLPELDAHAVRLGRLDREIRFAERRLAQLRTKRGELEAGA